MTGKEIIVIGALAAGAYLLLGGSGIGGGVEGGGTKKATAITGAINPTIDNGTGTQPQEPQPPTYSTDIPGYGNIQTPFEPSQYLLGLIAQKYSGNQPTASNNSSIPYSGNATIKEQVAATLTPITGNTVYQSRLADIVANDYAANTKKIQVAAVLTPITGNTVPQSRTADIVANAAANTKKQQVAAVLTPITGNTVPQSRTADIVAPVKKAPAAPAPVFAIRTNYLNMAGLMAMGVFDPPKPAPAAPVKKTSSSGSFSVSPGGANMPSAGTKVFLSPGQNLSTFKSSGGGGSSTSSYGGSSSSSGAFSSSAAKSSVRGW